MKYRAPNNIWQTWKQREKKGGENQPLRFCSLWTICNFYYILYNIGCRKKKTGTKPSNTTLLKTCLAGELPAKYISYAVRLIFLFNNLCYIKIF